MEGGGQALALDEFHAEVMLVLVPADLVEGHDVGMVETGGDLGLGLEALDVGGGSELAGQDHLEGDETVEAHLPRLVDNAHAAAGDLLQQLVVAEITDAGAGRPCHRPDRLRQPGEAILVDQEGAQLGGKLGMLLHPLLPVGRPTRLRRLEVGGQDGVQALLAIRRSWLGGVHDSLR
jgi:hypothetical protein